MNWWKTRHALKSIVGSEELWPVKSELAGLFKDQHLLDFGCGVGRLADAFDPAKYTGADFNRHCLEQAKKNRPLYDFKHVEDISLLEFDAILCYSVLHHISDEELPTTLNFLSTRKASNIVVAEVMDRKYRSDKAISDPTPTWNREPDEYTFEGYSLEKTYCRKTSKYTITFLEFKAV